MSPEVIADRVRSALPDARIELNGSDCSFELLVVSEQLAGHGAVARQRMLLGLFASELASGELHALTVRAKTPAELAASTSSNRVALGTLP